jgi:hypothetical protein
LLSASNSAKEDTGADGFSPSVPRLEMKRIIFFVAGGNESNPVFDGGGVVVTVTCRSRIVERFRNTSSDRPGVLGCSSVLSNDFDLTARNF